MLLVGVTVAIMCAHPLLAANDDLAGDWFLCGEDLQENATWEGNVVLSSNGSVTGGSINSSAGLTYSLVGGALSINGTGRVTGTIQDSDGVTTQMTMQMDPAKGLVAGEGNALVGSEDGVFILVRKTPNQMSPSVSIAIDQQGQRVELSISDLLPGSTYTIQRSVTLEPNDWAGISTFDATDTEKTWFESLDPSWAKAFWRVKNE